MDLLIKCSDISVSHGRKLEVELRDVDDSFLNDIDTLYHATNNNSFDKIMNYLSKPDVLDYCIKNFESDIITHVLENCESDIINHIRSKNINDILL